MQPQPPPENKMMTNMMLKKMHLYFRNEKEKELSREESQKNKILQKPQKSAFKSEIDYLKTEESQKNYSVAKQCIDRYAATQNREYMNTVIQRTAKLLAPEEGKQKFVQRISDNFDRSRAEVERQRMLEVQRMKMEVFKLEQVLGRVKVGDYREWFVMPTYLINTVYQHQQFPYSSEEVFTIVYSMKSDIYPFRRKDRKNLARKTIHKRGNRYLDDEQQVLYDIFNTNSSIHFQLYHAEIKCTLKTHRFKSRNGQFGYIYREDKNTTTALIAENEAATQLADTQHHRSQPARLSFLQCIDHFDLHRRPQMPPGLLKVYNLYRIFKEFLLSILDYLFLKEIARPFIYGELTQPLKLPSAEFRPQTTTLKDDKLDKDSNLRDIEKKVRIMKNRFTKQRIKQKTDPLFLTVDQAKDKQLRYFQFNAHQKQSNPPHQVTHTESVLKEKGTTGQYHQSQLELRGFKLTWYSNKVKRGEELLGDFPIKDQGLKMEERLFTVPLRTRELRLKLNSSGMGNTWRRILANQIAYKHYLHNLWINSKFGEECSISSELVDYFMSESCKRLRFSNESLVVQANFEYQRLTYRMLFDSMLYHQRLKEVSLQKVGIVALMELCTVLQDNRISPFISIIDLSDNQFSYEAAQEFCKFLMLPASNSLQELILNDCKLGDSSMYKICDALLHRYLNHWDQAKQQPKKSIKSNEKKKLQKNQIPLEFIRVYGFRNNNLTSKSINEFLRCLDQIMDKILNQQYENKEQNQDQKQQILKDMTEQIGKINYAVIENIRIISNNSQEEIDDLHKLLSIELDVSNNQLSDTSIELLCKLISSYDFLKELKMGYVKGQFNLNKLIEAAGESVNLESLDVRKVRCQEDFLQLLSENMSIQKVKWTQQEWVLDNLNAFCICDD